jgi:(1->4)-alpha-D-glucan 1-alpha-D-glucosylmutase
MSAPRATMRLQLNAGFAFADAAASLPYIAALGVSHIYASPIMTARPGSMHGYDTIDPMHVNPELGGEDGLRRLVRELRRHGMGLIVDIVPNHMVAGSGNVWWTDVLARGRDSRYAKYFDIDWSPDDPHLDGKVLIPILGRPYAEALGAGEITLRCDDAGKAFIQYFDHKFPVAAGSSVLGEQTSPAAFDPASAAGRERLHLLLEAQRYRLAWWRTANDEINWRRFFDINELVAVRVEDDEVFEAVHGTLFRLYAEVSSTACASTTSTASRSRGNTARNCGRACARWSASGRANAPPGPPISLSKKSSRVTKRSRQAGRPMGPPVTTSWTR